MKRVLGSLVGCLLCLAADASAERRPIPRATELASAERQVHDTFAEDYAKANRSPPKQATLARKLLAEGSREQNDAAVAFVLLRDARDLAAGAGDVKTLTAASDRMSQSYQITRSAALLPAIQAACKTTLQPDPAISLAETCLSEARDLVIEDDYEGAGRFVALAEQAARQARNTTLDAQINERAAMVRSARAGYQRAAAAIEKLKKDPDNSSLNFVVGKFYCFDKDDWEHGLPYLSRGSDASLKELAALDLKGPKTGEDQSALADQYWQAATRASSPMKTPLQNRARYWYAKALPSADGLRKTKIEERLYTEEVRKLHGMITPDDTKVRPTAEGVEITGKGTILTPGEVRAPLRIDVIAKTEATNIYLYFAEKGQVVFNWEAGSQQLWYHDPASGSIVSVEGQGRITPNTWAHISWVIEPRTSTILVNGKTRAVFHGKYAGVSGKAGVGGVDAKVSVRQFDVTEMPGAR